MPAGRPGTHIDLVIRFVRIAAGLVCLGAAIHGAAADLPSRARARNDVQDRWRARIAQAEQARGEGRLEDAEALYRGILDEGVKLQRPHMLLARAIDGMGDVYRVWQRLDEAAAYYRRAAEMWEPLLGADQPRLALTLHNLGTVYLAQGKLDDAGTAFDRALQIWEIALGAESEQARLTRSVAAGMNGKRDESSAAGSQLDR